jgi:hypothetical protein
MDMARSPSSGGQSFEQYGVSRSTVLRARHELTDGGVRITLPAGGCLTDAEACRLAWAILSDLAPDEVVAVPEVVTYSEAQRLAVVRALGTGCRTAIDVAAALSWGLRTAQRRLSQLVEDGRVETGSTVRRRPIFFRLKGEA